MIFHLPKSLLYAIVCASMLFTSNCLAERIYKHVDESGAVTFSSTPPYSGAQPAELPEINRGEMKLAKKKLESCSTHGGINCEAGPSATGSVICFDGYEGAAARYKFSCSSAKLEIAQVGEISTEGIFSVTVRNSKSVVADSPELYLKQKNNDDLTLIGPAEIEPFGVGEFVLDMKDVGTLKETPKKQDFRLLCKNCS